MRRAPYPAYKPSGVEWLGDVPAHWQVIKLGYIAKLKSGESITAEEISDSGDYPIFGGNGVRGYSSEYTHEGHYALIGRQGALCGNINYARGRFWASEHAVVVSPTCEISTTWLGELLRAMNLNQYSISAAQPGLSVETISALKIPYAPLIEQQAIAGFLDRETAKLDDLIGKKRTLIDALQEKRSALISRTVTRGLPPAAAQAAGLDPHPPMKPSGIDWLGEVPAHWEILVYKRLCDRIDVGIAEAATHAYTTDGGVPIIRSTNVKPNRLDTTDILRIDRDFAEKQKSKVLKAGDLVTVRTGYPGTTAVIPLEYDQSQCFTLVISTPRKTESPKFLSYYFNAFPGTSQFEREGWGAAQVNISVPIVQNLLVFRPSFSEQEAIANFLDVETAKIDKMIATIETAIEKLQEYRAALINAAVTGKIDVRKFASH